MSYVQGWFNQLINDLSFATGMMAIGTFFLAFITYWNIHSRNAQEQRDRKERYLNEILEWLMGIEDVIFPISDTNMYKEVLNKEDLASRLGFNIDEVRLVGMTYTPTTMHNIRTELRKGRYFSKLSFKLNSALGKLIDNILDLTKLRSKLVIESGQYLADTFVDITEQYKTGKIKYLLTLVKDTTKSLDGLELNKKNINSILTGRNAGEIINSIRKAIDKIIELKYIIK